MNLLTVFIGNRSIQDYFNKLTKSDGLSHAYLFYGPEGVGKKLFALKISEEMSGSLISNPDIRIIDKGDEEIYISDIRDLKSFIYLTPFGKYKFVLINNAQKLNQEASNALLKILEEPPGKATIFLITHLPKVLLPTVISRCHLVRFKPLTGKEIFEFLTLGKEVKKDIALSIVKLANGSLGLALNLADNFENFQKNINLFNKLIKADFQERFEAAKKISGSDDLKKIVGDWLIYSASMPDKKFTKELMYLSNIVSRPQFNHRLFLENFLINV